MPKAAYCSECKRFVWMVETGCENGHSMSCLRNVHDADALPLPSPVPGLPASTSSRTNPVARLFGRLDARLQGVIYLAIGLGLAKWQIYDPLNARALGLDHVYISFWLVAFAVIFPMVGAAYVAFGQAAVTFLEGLSGDPMHPSGKSVAITLAMVLPTLGMIAFVILQLNAQGYR
jgi:hypothetical protein